MTGYLIAEARRVVLRIPRLVCLAVLLAAEAGAIYFYWSDGTYTAAQIAAFLVAYRIVPGMAFAVIELIYLCGDDMNAKMSQSAIGGGMPRWKVVVTKWLEIVLTLLADLALAQLVLVLVNAIGGIGMTAGMLGGVWAAFVCGWLHNAAVFSLVLAVLFCTQSIPLGIVLYAVLASSLVNKILWLVFMIEPFARLRLSRFTLTTLANTFASQCQLQTFNAGALAGILVYLAAGLAAACLLFRGKELEF